jgi:hypothetical protein
MVKEKTNRNQAKFQAGITGLKQEEKKMVRRLIREDVDLYYLEELDIEKGNGETEWINLCIDREHGVKVFIQDMRYLFDDDFSEYLEQMHKDSEPEYAYIDKQNPEDEVIDLAVAVDMAYSLPEPNRLAVMNLLTKVEDRLVNIW